MKEDLANDNSLKGSNGKSNKKLCNNSSADVEENNIHRLRKTIKQDRQLIKELK